MVFDSPKARSPTIQAQRREEEHAQQLRNMEEELRRAQDERDEAIKNSSSSGADTEALEDKYKCRLNKLKSRFDS